MSTWRDQPAERQAPEWIRGWAIARFHHGDMRLWPEQQPGFEYLNREWTQDGYHGPSGYDWNGELELRGLTPPKDRQRYIHEGQPLPAQAVVALMAGGIVESKQQSLADIDIPF